MQRLHILVVEDQAILALGMGDLITSLGYRVVGPATTLAEAMRLVDTATVHGALLDLDLGGEQSTPLAERLSRMDIPFAWATGARTCPDDGRPVLRKPFSAPQLQETLAAMFCTRLTV